MSEDDVSVFELFQTFTRPALHLTYGSWNYVLLLLAYVFCLLMLDIVCFSWFCSFCRVLLNRFTNFSCHTSRTALHSSGRLRRGNASGPLFEILWDTPMLKYRQSFVKCNVDMYVFLPILFRSNASNSLKFECIKILPLLTGYNPTINL